jgi:hypothetical protein
VQQGSSGAVAFTSSSDPSPADSSAGLHYAYDFNNDGTFDSTHVDGLGHTVADDGTYAGSGASTSAVVPGSFLLSPGVHTVRGRVIDKDGGFTDYTVTFTVNNVSPTVTLPATTTANDGLPVTISGSFSDPGSAGETYTALVDFDYTGVDKPANQLTAVTVNPNHTFSVTHTYNGANTSHVVKVYITDSNGGTGTATSTVNVVATTLQVTTFTQTASGFDATFNKPITLGDLALYGAGNSLANSANLPVVLSGPNGLVKGSVLWDANTNTLHFIKTGGILADGNYTLTLRSGTTGTDTFHDNAGALDGNGDNTAGDNFTTTFTVANGSAAVLSIHDFARGSGQSVFVDYRGLQARDGEGNLVGGLPVTISNGAGVHSVEFTLTYDARDLQFSSNLLSDVTLPPNWSIQAQNTISGNVGTLHVVVFGSDNNNTLGAGPQTVVTFNNVVVPMTAAYGASDALLFSGIRVNESNIAAVGDSAVHKVVDLGDATGNSSVGPTDAAVIAQTVVGINTGFVNPNNGHVTDPLVDPTIIGDMTGDGTLSGDDAVAASQMFSDPQSEPQIPTPVQVVTPTTGYDPILRTGNGSAGPAIAAIRGSTVSVPVSISPDGDGDAAGTLGLALTFHIDPAVLAYSSFSASPGWSLTVNDHGDGTIVVGAFTSTAVSTPSVTPFSLNFSILPNATAGKTTVSVSGQDNEGGIVLTPDNGQVAVPVGVAITGGPASSTPEGTQVSYNASTTGADGAVTYAWTVTKNHNGVLTTGYATGSDAAFSFTPDDDGTYTVSLDVTDAAGNTGHTAVLQTVTNAAPSTPVLSLASSTIAAGQDAHLSGTFTDAGAADAHDVTIDWGDGSLATILHLSAGNDAFSDVTHTYATNKANNAAYDIHVTVTDGADASNADQNLTVTTAVALEGIYYKGSSFDQGDGISALATDKVALHNDQTASFANYTSYVRGINDVLVDIRGTVGAITAGDFTFLVGNSNDPNDGTWTAAPAPSAIIVHTAVNGVTRVEIQWPDNAIAGKWLQVTVKANAATTGLAADDVFYFGNAIGETGTESGNALVNSNDVLGARSHQRGLLNPAPITDAYDFDRDGIVNSQDVLIARSHQTGLLTALKLITPHPTTSETLLPAVVTPSVAAPLVVQDVEPAATFSSPAEALAAAVASTTALPAAPEVNAISPELLASDPSVLAPAATPALDDAKPAVDAPSVADAAPTTSTLNATEARLPVTEADEPLSLLAD